MKTLIFGKIALILLKALAKQTDNTVDDAIVDAVEKALPLVKKLHEQQ